MPARSPSSSEFATLGLAPDLVATLAALGYEEPTPVQRASIPLLLDGRDLLGEAATGTGKTAAFALPLLHQLLIAGAPGGGKRAATTAVLILVPTRELAMQVAEAVHKYARGTRVTSLPLYGGASMTQQIRALSRGCDVVIATPGRALDHLRRQTLDLSALRLLVLDEADEMLDMGFADDLDAILQATPSTRQTALFSATMPPRILAIARRHLQNPARVTIGREKTEAGKLPRVRQVAYVVRRAQKPAALGRILDMESPKSAIVFCRTRIEVDELVETLTAHGHRAEALHGGMQQRQRDAVMNRVRGAATDLLIATDVAARGLDIAHLSHVINYDLPAAAESYVHRIGRTGRAGREGTAITLLEPREHRLLRSIEHVTRQKIEVATVPTIADLRARRLDLTRASLRERLVAGDFDDVRVIVDALAEEFDPLDVAAAAVKLAHAAVGEPADGDDAPLDASPPAQGDTGAPRRAPAAPRGTRSGMVRLFVNAGRRAGVRPGDLVGAITAESGISSRQLGSIEIADAFSLVEVDEDAADAVIKGMNGAQIRGQKIRIRRDRDT